MAFPKAQMGALVSWIGVDLRIQPLAVEASIPEEKLKSLLAIIQGMASSNVLPVKELRSFAGKATNISTLLYMWRPFLL